jgi:DNA-directed RNA polymerase specialized sigma24 family protein
MAQSAPITDLLLAWRGGERAALDELLPLVYLELRFFGGLTAQETAEVLSLSEDTVLRDWRLAKGWLLRELTRSHGG